MIPADTTLNEVLDTTFATDAQLVAALTLTGSVSNGGWNDASASAAGVAIGGLYYSNHPATGSVLIRLT